MWFNFKRNQKFIKVGGIIMSWYLNVLKKYAVFSGRARRKEYWMFVLMNGVIGLVIAIIQQLLNLSNEFGVGVLSSVYSLLVLIPGIAVTVRRLHDTNRSAWWLLLALIPLANIAVFIFLILDSKDEGNRFGPSPKAEEPSFSL